MPLQQATFQPAVSNGVDPRSWRWRWSVVASWRPARAWTCRMWRSIVRPWRPRMGGRCEGNWGFLFCYWKWCFFTQKNLPWKSEHLVEGVNWGGFGGLNLSRYFRCFKCRWDKARSSKAYKKEDVIWYDVLVGYGWWWHKSWQKSSVQNFRRSHKKW